MRTGRAKQVSLRLMNLFGLGWNGFADALLCVVDDEGDGKVKAEAGEYDDAFV